MVVIVRLCTISAGLATISRYRADVHTEDDMEFTPYQWASYHNDTECMVNLMLLRHETHVTPHLQRFLMEAGAKPRESNSSKMLAVGDGASKGKIQKAPSPSRGDLSKRRMTAKF